MALIAESLIDFKLFENIEEAKRIFAENDVSTNDPLYIEFFNLLKDDPENYAGKFAKWMIEDPEKFDELKFYYEKQKKKGYNIPVNSFQNLDTYIRNVRVPELKQDQPIDKNIVSETPPKPIKSEMKPVAQKIEKINKESQKAEDRDEDDIKTTKNEKTTKKLMPLKTGYECLPEIYNTEAMTIPGQGLYIWAYKDDLIRDDCPLKFGEYGSKANIPKTPLDTISGYRAGQFKTVVILYAVKFTDELITKFGKAIKAEYEVQEKIKKNKGFRVGKHEIEGAGIVSREVFGGISLDKLISVINDVLYGTPKLKNFPMREEQKQAFEKIVNYFEENPPSKNKPTEFLLAAKMRFGKNFTLLNVAKEMKFKNILVLTYKPHVFSSLKDDIESHVNFDGWDIVDFKNKRDFNQAKDTTRVFMSSAQLAQYKKTKVEDEENEQFEDLSIDELRENLNKLKKIPWDLIIADEYHYGTNTLNFHEMLDQLNYNYIVYVSGTAMKDIAMGRFEDEQIYEWSYIEEQKQKRLEKQLTKEGKATSKEHLSMPSMQMYLIDIDEQIVGELMQHFKPEEGFTMDKLIGTDSSKKLKWPGLLERLLKQIMGTGSDPRISPFSIKDNLNHTLWVLPKNTAGIKQMAEIMKKMPEFEGFDIIPATGNVVTDIDEVKERINKSDRTITLTCYRFKEGTSVPEWNGVLMLDDGKSIEEYLQAIFRVQNPNPEENKDECYVFDFNPTRALKMTYEICENTDKSGKKSADEVIREYLDYAPILDYRNNQFKRKVKVDEIIEAFRVHGSFSEKFANRKNFNVEKIDDDIIFSVWNLGNQKRGQEFDVNVQNVEKGKNIHQQKIAASKKPESVDLGDEKLKKKTIDKISNVLAAIPLFLFDSQTNEKTVDQIIYTDEPELFKEITGIDVDTFKMWNDKKLINTVLLNRNIFNFLQAEQKVLENATLESVDNFVKQHFSIRAEEGSTPAKLVNEMLDKLPNDVWIDPNKKFCDPCMGTGKYILGIKERLMEGLKTKIPNEKEREKHIVEEMLWGVDIAKGKTSIAKRLINNSDKDNPYKDNLLTKDSLNLDWNKMPKFDVVVGNPPFQKEVKREKGTNVSNAGAKIWHYFVEIGFSILNKNGIIAFITPDLWRTGPKKTIKEAQELIWNNNIIFFDSANNFFDVGGIVNIDYWIVSKNFNLDGVTIDPIFKKNKFLPISKNSQIKQFYKDIEKNDNFEMNVKSNSHYPNEIRKSEKGDENRKFPHVSTITQYMKNLYDWYEYKTEGFDHPKVITSTTISKNLNSFYDPGKVGTGHSSVGYLVKDKNEGDQLVNFLNNSKIIKMIEKETQNEKGFTGFPLQLFKKIPKSWVERFSNGEDL